MDSTFGYILVCQSPALFLAAIVLLISYFTRKRNHHVRAVLNLILAIACAICGVALYYVGMLHEHFDIHNFYQIRVWGWIGFAIVAALAIYVLYRNFKRMSDKRKAEKEANRSENERKQELEKAKAEAYEAGKAEAQAAADATPVVPVAVPSESAEAAPAATILTPVEPDPTPTSGELKL